MTLPDPQTPRVLHVLPIIGVAGAEQMAANLLIALSRSFRAGVVGLFDSINSSTETAMRNAGIPLWFLGKQAGFDPRMFWRLDRVIREFQPNIVHSHLSVLRYLLPSLIFRRDIIAVHTIHNLAERETDRLGRMIHKPAFERFVVPVAVSRAVARSVGAFYRVAEPPTIPNGVPVDSFRFDSGSRVQWRRAQKLEDGAFLFIATGRLEPQKNPLLLLRAFSELAGSRCHLAFVGDGPLRPRVQEQIQLMRLENRVHLLGRRSDVRECLAAADAFVLCSDWEGNPLGLMEAMAGGLPVIATSVGGVPELVEDRRHGLLVEAGNAGGLATAMRSLLDSPDLRRAIGEAARRRAQTEFTVDRMVDSYAGIYRFLLERVYASTARQAPALQGL